MNYFQKNSMINSRLWNNRLSNKLTKRKLDNQYQKMYPDDDNCQNIILKHGSFGILFYVNINNFIKMITECVIFDVPFPSELNIDCETFVDLDTNTINLQKEKDVRLLYINSYSFIFTSNLQIKLTSGSYLNISFRYFKSKNAQNFYSELYHFSSRYNGTINFSSNIICDPKDLLKTNNDDQKMKDSLYELNPSSDQAKKIIKINIDTDFIICKNSLLYTMSDSIETLHLIGNVEPILELKFKNLAKLYVKRINCEPEQLFMFFQNNPLLYNFDSDELNINNYINIFIKSTTILELSIYVISDHDRERLLCECVALQYLHIKNISYLPIYKFKKPISPSLLGLHCFLEANLDTLKYIVESNLIYSEGEIVIPIDEYNKIDTIYPSNLIIAGFIKHKSFNRHLKRSFTLQYILEKSIKYNLRYS